MRSRPAPSRLGKYRLIAPILSTCNSHVYVVLGPETRDRRALKIMDHSVIPRDRLDSECQIQTLLHHPYVMPLLYYFDCDNFRAMLMPRAMGGSLADEASNPGLSDPISFAKLFYRLLKGVQHMHSHHILHGDLKPGNVVLREQDLSDPHPMIIDFGHAADLSKCSVCNCRLMTCAYSAPEVLGLQPHSLPSDVWAIGATVYYVIERKDLLCVTHLEVMHAQAARLRVEFQGDGWRRHPVSLQEIVRGMLRPIADQRLTVNDCLGHAFFTEVLGAEWIAEENGETRLQKDFNSGAPLRTLSGGDNAHL